MFRYTRIAHYWVRTAGLPERVQALMLKYPQVPPEQIREMASVDPTGEKGQYLEWIVRKTKDGNIRWPEDKNRVQRALAGFQEIKKKPSYFRKYDASPDINTYTLHTLEALYRQVHGIVPEQAEKDPSLPPGSSVFYQDQKYRVIKIGGPGTDIKQAAQAACHFGEGTFWCTGEADTAETYLERGPLFIIYEGKMKIAQTDGDQVMDTDDNPYPAKLDRSFWELLIKLGIISKAKWVFDYTHEMNEGRQPALESDILPDPTYRKAYLRKFVREPWPEAVPYILRDGDPEEIYFYAKNCLGGKRWPAGEKILLASNDPEKVSYLLAYALNAIKGRWPEAEPTILRSLPYQIFHYVKESFHGQRWPEAESVLLARASGGDPDVFYDLARYATEVIKGRWPEAEPYIIRAVWAFRNYVEGLNLDPKAFIEEFIQTHGPAKG